MLLKRNHFKDGARRREQNEVSEHDKQKKREQRKHSEDNEESESEQRKHSEDSEESEREQSEREQEQSEQRQSEREQSEREQRQNEREQGDQEDERKVDLRDVKNNEFTPNTLSDILNLYYEGSSELERNLSQLKRERKRMKITYINRYLNPKEKLSKEENIKRQQLKQNLLENGQEITNTLNKLQRIKDDIIGSLQQLHF